MNWIFSRVRAVPDWVAVLAIGFFLVGVFFIMPGEYGHAMVYSMMGITSAIAACHPSGDAVVQDQSLESLGRRFQLRIQRPGLPALFMPGCSVDELTRHGVRAEDRYVGKPFKAEENLDALFTVIGYEFTR